MEVCLYHIVYHIRIITAYENDQVCKISLCYQFLYFSVPFLVSLEKFIILINGSVLTHRSQGKSVQ